MKRRFKLAAAAGVVALVLALSAGVVLTAPDAALPWSVFGGGGSSSSTNYELGSTSGQSSPIGESNTMNYELCAGFWCGAVPAGLTGTPLATVTPAATVTPTPTVTGTPPTATPTVTGTPPTATLTATGTVVLVATSTPTTSAPATPTPTVLIGDVNCDGLVNSIDAALVLQFVAALLGSVSCPDAADVNGDADVTSVDAALILQFTAGLLGSLPP